MIDEIRPIFDEHHAELALYQGDIALDPDYEIYKALEARNSLAIYTVRLKGELVGYAVYFIRPHHHYRTAKWAMSDVILVRKAHRNYGLGGGLFNFLERDLKASGADVIHTMTKTAHPELARLLESRGHAQAEVSYSKRL